MDKSISAAEANRQFSRILREVKGGDIYTVTARGEPVARIVPVGADQDSERKAFDEWIALARARPALNLNLKWTRDELYDG